MSLNTRMLPQMLSQFTKSSIIKWLQTELPKFKGHITNALPVLQSVVEINKGGC